MISKSFIIQGLTALLILALTSSVNAAAIAPRQPDNSPGSELPDYAEFANGRQFLLSLVVREGLC
jgi:hypothetical protein